MRVLLTTFLFASLFFEVQPANAQLYVTGIDGSGTKEVDHVPFYPGQISLNRSGNELLLAGEHNNLKKVFSITSTGNSLKQLTPDSAPQASTPVFAPDQTRIVYTEINSPSENIYLIDKSWGNKILLNGNGGDASFSADGSKMVFERTVGAAPNLSIVLIASKQDGTSEQQITALNALALSPSFNPQDNQKIVFSEIGTGIVIINADGTGRQVVLKSTTAFEPVFTADGKRIVYSDSPTTSNLKYDLFIMDSNGANATRLTNVPLMWCRLPAVSPDGKQIFFVGIPLAKVPAFRKKWLAKQDLPIPKH